MDHLQKTLLDKRQIILLPEHIGHAEYERLFYLLEYAKSELPGRRIQLLCKGDGGDARSGWAVVQAIREHGAVDGVLNGEALSTHANIWAGCDRRYVLSLGAIGIHPVASTELTGFLDADTLAAYAHEYHEDDRRALSRFVEISRYEFDYEWWSIRYFGAGQGVHMIDAEQIVDMGMATALSRPVVVSKNGAPEQTQA